jgi:hypothetical protein
MLAGALFGGAVSIRQILLHICPGTSSYGAVFFGLGLYTWSFLVFVGTVVFVLVNLTVLDVTEEQPIPIRNKFYLVLEILFGIIVLLNVLEVGWQCGLGQCEDVPPTVPSI